MSFERAHNATSRADQTTVRRANLGVVLQQIAAGEPRSRARVAAETGPDARDGLEPRRRADRARPAPRDGRGRALRARRPAGPDARAGRPRRRDRARGQRRLPRRLCRGSDRDGSLRAARPHRQPALLARARARPAGADGAMQALAAIERGGPAPGRGRRSRFPASSRRRPERCCGRRTSAGRRSPSPTSSLPGSRTWPCAPRTRRTSLRSPSTGRARRAISTTSSACSARWASGGGIFVDGELFRGAHGFGGEFGHITVDPRRAAGAIAARRGCLETFVGQEAIARRAGIAVGAERPHAQRHRRSSCGAREEGDARPSSGAWPKRAATSASGSPRR